MKLQGSDLKMDSSGEEVKLLHSELMKLGFDIPVAERQESTFGEGTHKTVIEFQRKHGLETTGIVDERTAEAIDREVDQQQAGSSFLVKGTVRHVDGKPFAQGLVRAFDRDLRSEQKLGEATTDGQGRYEVRYSADQFRRAEKISADLVVRAYNNADDREPAAVSPIFFNAGAEETIDLVVGGEVYRGPSEYEDLVAKLTPLLPRKLSFAKLREDDEDNGQDKHQDVTFLSGETKQDPGRIAFLALAHRLRNETRIPAEVFYGMFRQGLPTQLPALLAQSPDVQRRALVRSAEANIIPSRFGTEADAMVDRFKMLIVRQAMKQPPDGGDGTATLNDLLGLTLSDAKLREDFLRAYVGHTGPVEDFWKGLAAQPKFKDHIAGIQLTLQLGALTGNHLPLVRELRKMLHGDSVASTETGWFGRFLHLRRRAQQGSERSVLSALTALDEKDWLELITKDGDNGPISFPPGVPGKDDAEKALNYASAMAHIVEDAFPTAFITQRLETDDLPGKDDLLTFFKANPEFDIRTTRLGSYLKEHPRALDNVAEADRERTEYNIKTMQRLYKLAPRYAQTSALMKSGLDSAHRISRMGRNVFMSKYGDALGGNAQARSIYDRASEVQATAMSFVADHGPVIGRIGMNALPDETVTEVDGVPEWSTLFGSIELCECEHCRSIHGPAAYLVDILKFLRDRDSKIAGKSAKDILFGRRPDLGEIELTCENTNTPLPYVDLVNEALENAVAPFPAFVPFDLPPAVETDLNNRTVSQALSNAFRDAFNPPLPLSTEAVITVGAKGKPWDVDPNWWTIEEPGFTYTIRKDTGTNQLHVVARSLQTRGSEAERAANPQYVNADAYRRLSRAVYPWSLPFPLWWEEARAYLAHLGVPRHRIMEGFRPGNRAAILNDVAVAYEYLGLSHEVEMDNAGNIVAHHGTAPIITGRTTSDPGATSRGLWNLWGFATQNLSAQDSIIDPSDSTRRIAGGNWLSVLSGRVDVFLHQSGLKYKELLDLLATYYVNPVAGNARAIRIVSHDPINNAGTCETDKLRLRLNGLDLDQAAAARIVRFVRLWRALGWSMRDLDRAITVFEPNRFGDLNVTNTGAEDIDRFLVRLAHVQRLRAALNVPVARLLSWWAEIDTAFYIDHGAPGQPRAASLYDQLFRNRTVTNPLDPDFPEDASKLDQTRKLSDKTATITAALGISAADFTLLFNDGNVIARIPDPADPTKTIPDDRLTLGYLSRLHRHASLAKALRLPVRDYLVALKLIAANPFAATTDTVIFVETVDRVREAGFTFGELDYLLRHAFTPESAIAPTDEAIATFLNELRAGLQKIAEENTFRTALNDPAEAAIAFDPTEPTTDLNGDLTRQKLALLNWDRDWVDEAVATLNGAVVYEEPLAALPGGLVIPAGLRDVLTFDDNVQPPVLKFAGPMTDAQKALLEDPQNNPNPPYLAAVQALYDKPRGFIGRAMRTFAVHPFAEGLAALPANVKIPAALKHKVYFEPTAGRLHCQGVMTAQERDTLVGLSTDAADPNHAAYQTAVDGLYDQPAGRVPDPSDAFLTNSDAATLFDTAVAPGDRFLLVLKKLLPYLRRTLSEQLAVQKMAEAVQLEARSADALLRTWLTSPVDPEPNPALKRRSLAELLDPAFAESNTNVQPTPKTFSAQFKTYLRLHKAALVAARFKLTHRQLGWLFEHGPGASWLDLNTLPVDEQGPPAAFDGWLRLAEMAMLRDGLPQGENALDEILARASAVDTAAPAADKEAAKEEWFAAVTRWTLWTLADLEALLGAADDHTQTGPLNITFPGDYLGVRLLVRLREAFDLLKRLGTSAKQASDLTEGNVTLGKARGVRQAVRAKYDEAQWLNLAKPLHDVLREKKRAALVAYLVAHLRLPFAQLESPHPELVFNANPLVTGPAVRELQQKLNAAGANPPLKVDGMFGQTTRDALDAFQRAHGLLANGIVNAATWAELDKVRRGPRDANDLFAHFLIDVEMDPCMVTSRIKQALSSVQLFVQRCFINLEPDVAASAAVDEKWREWRWIKNYRVWEANRKIFLYPENWIEPELRDDKSPFFKELESELLQSDLTLETAEDAFLHYLEKLDQVARLEIVGIYHQVEEDSIGNTAADILHVFGRTPGTPHVYFYRQRVDSAYWTPWERLDLDIEGDHLIPVVWNRRLMLFWPIFTEKAKPFQVTLTGSNLSGTPEMYWEIKLAWSERKQGKWTNKRVSSQPLGPIPLFRPGVNNNLSLHDDPSHFFFRTVVNNDNNLHVLVLSEPVLIRVIRDGARALAFRFDGCHAEPAVTSYVPPNTWTWPDDLQFVPVTDTVFDLMFYREDVDIEHMVGEKQLYLPAPTNNTVALAKTPGTFLLLPYPDGSRISEHPFFFQDDKRTFFVIPSDPTPSPRDLAEAEKVDPDIVIDIPDHYWREVSSVPDHVGPMVNPDDPRISPPSYPVMPEATLRQTGGGVIVPDSGGNVIVPGDGIHMARASTSARIGLHDYRPEKAFRFQTFYHPYVCAFVRELNRNGVDGLLQRPLQKYPHEFAPQASNGQPLPPLDFKNEYDPQPIVLEPYPVEGVEYDPSAPDEQLAKGLDFNEDGAYALYNWELFFHAPLLIADRLSKNQRYEDAQKWFHYIFDPTDASSLEVPQRYWRTKPFNETTREDYQRERIQYILDLLAKGANPQTSAQLTPGQMEDLERFQNLVARWRKDPFKPHLIARMRTTAYQKTVVMRYIDNLIGWADQLFRRDTIESNNEATQLYILAAEILGRRPEGVPPRATPQVETYNSLEPKLDAFSNALVQIEELISPSSNGSAAVVSGQQPPTLPLGLYFCVSKNDKLLGYWDTVADRLFKLRHCMNIEGVARQLPLFEPPIEPGLLVKAAAAGVDLGSVLNDLSAAQPHYRFNVLAQKATELCAELKSLGQSMLSALEKRDAEQLSLLRAQQETDLLALVEQVRKLQYDEAEQNKTALSRSRDATVSRFVHNQKLLGVQSPQVPGIGEAVPEASPSPHIAIQEEGGIKMIPFEKEEVEQLETSKNLQISASSFDALAGALHLIPNFAIEPYGVGQLYGGSNFGSASSAVANVLRAVSTEHNHRGAKALKLGQYALRAHEWLLQSNLAAREIMQIDQQYLAAELRRQIAGKELSNHKRQLDNAREVEEFLRDKYTNQELYGWMIGQLATVYFQTYQLAYDLAKRAERAFRHELGLQDSNYVQFGYWDSLKKGLLAGERLYHDLKRMEVAYLDQHKREYEITKHVSLAQLDPLALVQLRQAGTCLVRLPEVIFDLDYPGHYMRRIRSVSVSIPCVTGPYTGVNCTLTLLKSSLRHGNTLLGGKYARQEEGDPRFTDSLGAIQSIVTSDGQNDGGLFEANLRDERYLPFEGAGVLGDWQIELPAGYRQFDYDTISDVILHVSYTAREGGGLLKQQATLELQTEINEFIRSEGQQGPAQIFSLRHEFPTEWHRFLNPANAVVNHNTVTLGLTKDRFPFLFQNRRIDVRKIEIFIKVKPDSVIARNETTLKLTFDAGDTAPTPDNPQVNNHLLSLAPWNGLLRTEKTFSQQPGSWTINAWLDEGGGPSRLDPDAIEAFVLLCEYTVE